jgi:uncharacterized protein
MNRHLGDHTAAAIAWHLPFANRRGNMMLKTICTVATLLISAAALTPAFSEDAKLNRIISLSGHGEVRASPDMATVTLGVLTSAPTAREALDANTKAMTDLLAVLKAANIEPKDIMTSNFNVTPRYDYGQNNGQPPKVTGYDVSNNVMVTLHKLDGIGDLLDKAVSSGSNQINGIAFGITDPQTAMDEARKEAVKDAKRKADLYAAATSVTLGNVVSLSEGGGYQPQPMEMRANMKMSADAGPVPIAQGEQVVAVDVNISWEIK